jgi:predicted aspartyl protease
MRVPLFAACLLGSFSLAAQSNTQAAPAKRSCRVVHAQPTDGDTALAKTDYDAALKFYRAAVDKDPASEEAWLGLVRALIGKDQVDDAQREAQASIEKSPQSAIAEVAAGEAAYRAADFVSMKTHASSAISKDPCEGRGYALAAGLYGMSAYYATEATLLNQAHRLRPDDELIRRDWIQSLPRKERGPELAKYLEGPTALADKDRRDLENEQAHLKSRRPGECRIVSHSETSQIPMQPVYGDHSYPVAFGLDVALNGKKRRMQIDTGASGIVLSPAAAKRLGLTPELHLHAGGVGDEGDVDSYLTHVVSIQIGNVEFADCTVEVLQKSKLDVDGLIGLDVFARWLPTLDYQNERLNLAPLPPRPDDHQPPALNTAGATGGPPAADASDEEDDKPRNAIQPAEMKNWLPILRLGHDVLLPSTLNGSGKVHYVIADTGSSQTVLSTAYAREAGKLHEDSGVQFEGISGKVKKVYQLENAKLRFGMFQLTPQNYFAFDLTKLSHDEGVELSGLIGLPTLSRLSITIDYRDNLVELKYDPKHDVQRF